MITEDRVFNWTMAGLAFAAIMALSWSAKAEEQPQLPCITTEALNKAAKLGGFTEKAGGLDGAGGSAARAFSNAAGLWELWISTPDGRSCQILTGTDFFSIGTGRNI